MSAKENLESQAMKMLNLSIANYPASIVSETVTKNTSC